MLASGYGGGCGRGQGEGAPADARALDGRTAALRPWTCQRSKAVSGRQAARRCLARVCPPDRADGMGAAGAARLSSRQTGVKSPEGAGAGSACPEQPHAHTRVLSRYAARLRAADQRVSSSRGAQHHTAQQERSSTAPLCLASMPCRPASVLVSGLSMPACCSEQHR